MSTVVRMLLSHLADAGVRRNAGRWLLALCAAGFLLSTAVLAALGSGLDRWVFVLLVWIVLVFLPLRIFIESSEALGAGSRRRLASTIAADAARYDNVAYLPHIVRALAARHVTMPRICGPHHARAASAGAEGLLHRARIARDPREALGTAIRGLLGLIAHEAAALGAAAAGAQSDNIQARWDAARGLGSLTAVVTILVAAYADRWHEQPAVPDLEDRGLAAYLAAAMDYCDEAALQVDVLPWTEPPLASPPPDQLLTMRESWQAFLAAGLPAPRALTAFADAVLPRHSPY